MEGPFIILLLVGFFAAWTLFLYVKSGSRIWSPLWMAFSATAAAALFLVTGSIGYTLNRHVAFSAGSPWSGQVIWWEISVGVGLALIAVYLWRVGLRSLRTSR